MFDLSLAPAYATTAGRCYHADSLDVLRQIAGQLHRPRHDLAPVRPAATEGLRQRRRRRSMSSGFGRSPSEIHRVLRPDGSFVLDLGGAWNRGSGTRLALSV